MCSDYSPCCLYSVSQRRFWDNGPLLNPALPGQSNLKHVQDPAGPGPVAGQGAQLGDGIGAGAKGPQREFLEGELGFEQGPRLQGGEFEQRIQVASSCGMHEGDSAPAGLGLQ